MFDDLRAQASEMEFEDEPEEDAYAFKLDPPRRRGPFLGMSAPQRFVIAVMMLLMACILSSFCLLVTEKIWLPIFN
jgi:hypothetical protein